ncbi:hypothetical protein [Solimonas soli]|uniref:hypothetical protein n=1 Tax=Solimonas soli TaxID=413479 RepID=UPI000483192B|nr:hypothetical protein [Solimonas soli]
MTLFSQWRHGWLGPGLMVLAACSSQNDSIDTPDVRPVSVAPAGIYEGTWTAAGGAQTAVTAFLGKGENTEKMMVFDADGARIASGVYTTVEAARSISWTARVFEPVTTTDEDSGTQTTTTGVTTLTGQGAYAEEDSVQLSFTRSTGGTGTLALSYDADAYETRSDVSLIQGDWGVLDAYGTATTRLSVDAGGGFSGSNADGCTYNGKFVVIAQQYNLYRVTLTTSCPGSSTSVITDGLASLLPAAAGESSPTLVAVANSDKAATLLRLEPL